jgi:hypothetical protein
MAGGLTAVMQSLELNSPPALPEISTVVEDLRTRAIQPYHVVSARHDRQAVRNLAVEAAELDHDRGVAVLLRGDIDRAG